MSDSRWLNQHPPLSTYPSRKSRAGGSECNYSPPFALVSNYPCFLDAPCIQLAYPSWGRDGLMRPLITHCFNKTDSPHFPPPSKATSFLSFVAGISDPSLPTPCLEPNSSLNSRHSHPRLLWVQDCLLAFLPFCNSSEGRDYTGLICSCVSNA